jgi:hypothetical protein
MPPSASTGSGRRRLLEAAGFLPAALLLPARSEATDYASAAEALRAVEDLAAEVAARLSALASRFTAARAFAESLLRDQARHRTERDRVRSLLRLEAPPPRAGAAPADALDLEALKSAQQKLTYALAESLPVLGRAPVVRTLARQMVDCSRHLTLVGLWIEAEERRAS